MESLVRFLIGSILICQFAMPFADSKVIKKEGISESEVNYERSNEMTVLLKSTLSEPQVEFNKTSINYTNATSMASSGSDINSFTHIAEKPHLDARSLSKIHNALHGVKRSFKKIFFAWTYYGPEIGLCSCLFKYAWFTYPVVPEVTYAAMGRARRMVNGFVDDFMSGFRDSQSKDHYRISNKVAETTADDFFDYQSSNQVYKVYDDYGPYRRVSNRGVFSQQQSPEDVPLIEKANPEQLNNVVELLKNLQPKLNASDFVVRMSRHIKSLQQRKSNNRQQFRTINDDGDEIRYFAKHNEGGQVENATRPAINNLAENKAAATVVVEGRSSFTSNALPTSKPKIDRAYSYGPPPSNSYGPPPPSHSYGPPPAASYGPPPSESYGTPSKLPKFNELPPADYSYYKDGTHYHVHDLRKNKGPIPVKGGGWLSIDFEEAILSALGLSNPGRSHAPTVTKCSKIYIFNAILRFFQTALIG